MNYLIGEHLATVIKERDQLKQERDELARKLISLQQETEASINRKLNVIMDSISFRLPYAQKGEEDYGRQESEGSGIEGSSASAEKSG